MVPRSTIGVRVAAVAFGLAVVCGAIPARGQAGSNTTPSAAAEPTIPGNSTLDRITKELFGPLEPYGPKGMMDRATEPPSSAVTMPRPRIEDDGTRAARLRQQDWFFTGLNDLASPPTLEDLAGIPSYGPDGRDKRTESPMERYFEALNAKPKAGSNYMNDLMNSMLKLQEIPGLSGSNSLAPLMPGMTGSAQGETRTGDQGLATQNGAQSVGSSENDATKALQRQQRHIADFQRLLDPTAQVDMPAGPADALGRFTDMLNSGSAQSSVATPAIGVFAPPSYSAPAVSIPGSSAPVNAGFHPSTSSGGYTAYAPAAPKSTAPPAPAPSAKSFSLDPFQDNMPKRAF